MNADTSLGRVVLDSPKDGVDDDGGAVAAVVDVPVRPRVRQTWGTLRDDENAFGGFLRAAVS